MSSSLENLLFAVIPLFVVIDPIGLIPIFLGMTKGIAVPQRRKIADQAILTTIFASIGFIFLGKIIFRVLGIGASDFKIAGGIILLVFATKELLGFEESSPFLPENFGVAPLAIPLIAGPATFTTLLILMDSVGLVITLTGFAINLLVLILSFRFSEKFVSWIGITGLRGISKIVALFLAAIAVNMIRKGWQAM